MKRRDLLKALSALPMAGSAGALLAAPVSQPRLLVVFLRGAYDASSLLVPISSDYYYEARPNIALPRPGTSASAALPLSADWGLHPALADNIHPLFTKGQAAFIPFAGTRNLSRSHFETQDTVEMGQADSGRRNYESGFLNRLAETLNGAGAISFTDRVPLVFQGKVQVPNTMLRTAARSNVNPRERDIIASMYKGTDLAKGVVEGFAFRDDVARELNAEMEAASRNAITTRGFALEAQRVALLMKDKYRIGFIDVGGWDTHVNQGGATGLLSTRLNELGRGLSGFADAMGPEWRNTVVVVLSEFGRTFRENGNRGTDHGHGSVYWMLGGGIRGGRMYGEQIPVTRATLNQDRDTPVLNEYRALLGGLFRRMYGLNTAQLAYIFPEVTVTDLGII